MVESGLFPIVRDMAFSAVRPKLAGVMVVFGMACVAILRRALEDIVGVAGRTVHSCVPAQQLESGLIMIKGNLVPGIRDVACAAVRSELAVMWVIPGVAGRAILRGGFKIRNVPGASVAASAGG